MNHGVEPGDETSALRYRREEEEYLDYLRERARANTQKCRACGSCAMTPGKEIITCSNCGYVEQTEE